MRTIFLLIILCCFSCDNERILQLPEIENADVTEILDVSAAYIFYDESEPDSTLLNRKNLIGTTNWLVNVDKRLSLRQALPHIKFLQNKKRDAEVHKNENAKNYFTCNDTSIGNLGFMEFTNTDYQLESSYNDPEKSSTSESKHTVTIDIENSTKITLSPSYPYSETIRTTINDLPNDLLSMLSKAHSAVEDVKLILRISNQISFQDYISLKSKLLKLESDKIIIDSNEFIY